MAALGDWLTTQEAAEMAGYHVNYIRRLLRTGEIDARKWGTVWMVSRESLQAYLKRLETQGERRGPKSNKVDRNKI